MMILRSSPPSPFGRKVKIVAKLLHVMDRIEIVDADTTREDDSLRQQNPLGKIPTLVLENGSVLYDSRVIVEYLDHLAGGGLIIPQGKARFDMMTRQALADGIMDAALMQVYEARWRAEEHRDAKWVAHQAGKVARGLAALEAAPPKLWTMPDGLPNLGAIAVACALGYLDLRFAGSWRAHNPRLVAWLDEFASRVPAFAATKVHP
jgi:glutathione S-transferase